VTVAPWLWAVHISDGILSAPWLVGGYVVALALAAVGARKVADEEIPPIALLASAFFVASLIHVPVGPTSVHLLLNGLLGVVLGTRACLAIPVGLCLQAALIGHGGFSTLGVNTCVLATPALIAGWAFAALQRLRWPRMPAFRFAIVAMAVALWALAAVYTLALLAGNTADDTWSGRAAAANGVGFHPAMLCVIAAAAVVAAWAERRIETRPEFPLGLLVGIVAVLLTLGLDSLVLLWGGGEDWHSLVLLLFLAHLPIAVLEGLVLGFTVGFLARVKPDLIAWRSPEKLKCPVDALA
jgi:cobalt/nickel transport system permease protein